MDRRFLYPLQNLLTFATDRPNAMTRQSFIRRDDPSRPPDFLDVVGPRIFTDVAVAAKALPHDMLFTLDDVRDRFEILVPRWLALSETYRGAFESFFSAQYASRMYQDLRLQVAAHALHLYHESRVGGLAAVLDADPQIARVRSQMSAEAVPWLQAIVSGNQLFRVEKALTALLAEHQQAFAPL